MVGICVDNYLIAKLAFTLDRWQVGLDLSLTHTGGVEEAQHESGTGVPNGLLAKWRHQD